MTDLYRITIRRPVLKSLQKIPADYTRLLAKHIDALASNPRPPDSKKLKGDVGYSLRVGVYRILYDIDDSSRIVEIYRIKHRRDVYR